MFKAILLYWQFFTAIPINVEISQPKKSFQQGINWFWLAALLYSSLLGGIFMLATMLWPTGIAWTLTIVADILLTRGFHYDALADMADGLFSSRSADKMLDIMKDSRVGTNGVMALNIHFSLMLMGGLTYLTASNDWIQQLLFVITVNLAARGSLALLFFHFHYPPNRPQGLGEILVGMSPIRLAVNQGFFMLVIALLQSWPGLISYLLTLGGIILYRKFVIKQIGGLNGDTAGAAALLGQLLYLLGFIFLSGLN